MPNFFIAFIAETTYSEINKFWALEDQFAKDANKIHLIVRLLSQQTENYLIKIVILFLIIIFDI